VRQLQGQGIAHRDVGRIGVGPPAVDGHGASSMLCRQFVVMYRTRFVSHTRNVVNRKIDRRRKISRNRA
jgi:hypothetical protein